jgi:hypothetical protein
MAENIENDEERNDVNSVKTVNGFIEKNNKSINVTVLATSFVTFLAIWTGIAGIQLIKPNSAIFYQPFLLFTLITAALLWRFNLKQAGVVFSVCVVLAYLLTPLSFEIKLFKDNLPNNKYDAGADEILKFLEVHFKDGNGVKYEKTTENDGTIIFTFKEPKKLVASACGQFKDYDLHDLYYGKKLRKVEFAIDPKNSKQPPCEYKIKKISQLPQ